MWLSSFKFSNVFMAMQHPWSGTFWGISGPFLPRIWLKFAEILTRGRSLIIQRESLNNFLKLSVSTETVLTQSWWFWFIFGLNLPPGKPKIFQKTIIFPETTPLWPSNNTSSRSKKNQRILIKLIKKTFLGQKRTFWGKK